MKRRLAYEEPSAAPPPRAPESVAPANATAREARSFDAVAQLAAPHDNAAIATVELEAGTLIRLPDGDVARLSCTVLEGHRFVVRLIALGELITSWGEPFGKALRPLGPGEWLRNSKTIHALLDRGLQLPADANFVDYVKPAVLNEETFVPGSPLPLERLQLASFDGFVRTPVARGVGTRNFLVILPLSSRSNATARALERRVAALARVPPCGGLDGAVALPHTEDGQSANASAARNQAMLVRTLLGLLLHPNVGAAVVIETSADAAAARRGLGISYASLVEAAAATGRTDSLDALPLRLLRLAQQDFGGELAAAVETAAELLPSLRAMQRERCSASSLSVAQQCGGSDAFSGTAANPLVAAASKLLIERGGTALLAETDELIGAEQYVISSTRDYPTARRFLHLVSRFQGYAHGHGASAEGNPSGGNMYRGLYNIALKSLGAAMKRHPSVRLEHVIEYAEPIPSPVADSRMQALASGGGAASATMGYPTHGDGSIGAGYCFMDSPGNDMESIAGQVASGCNLIYFSTGNGSITNFPFVPTIKIVSSTKRFTLLSADMDVDAADPRLTQEQRGEDLFRRTLAVASGERTKGEAAGHYQLQIWRNWERPNMPAGDAAVPAAVAGAVSVVESPRALPSSSPSAPPAAPLAAPPTMPTAVSGLGAWSAEPLALTPLSASVSFHLNSPPQYLGISSDGEEEEALDEDGWPPPTERVALIMPTSLCSSEVARTLAAELQAEARSGTSAAAQGGDGGGGSEGGDGEGAANSGRRAAGGVRFVALPHTEGCGVSDERIGAATLLGYLCSPLIGHALLLEHGCEKVTSHACPPPPSSHLLSFYLASVLPSPNLTLPQLTSPRLATDA